MRFVLLFCFSTLLTFVSANRTSCFAYVDCFERAQVQLKECVGGTAVALTVESKDQSWTAADLVKENGLIFNQCQDKLTREVVDFDTLQLLVQEDARECFEKLPGNNKRVSFNPAACIYSPITLRDSYGKDANQCVSEYFDDRQKCEQLLDCCPDHLRCAERMNAVSVAYQHARAKSIQIVNNMLKCLVSTEPATAGTVALIQDQRSTVKNAGIPFFRPDTATEERITRRLSLTSTATIEQRRQRFNRRYNQVRALLSQRVHAVTAETSRNINPSATTQIPSERRIAIIRNLLRNADDQDLAQYVSLIADGNFEKLSILEREKLNKMENEQQVDEAMQKMTKIRDAIKQALATKEQKTLNFLETSAHSQDKLALASHKQKGEENEWNSDTPLSGLITKAMSEIDSDTLIRAKKFANALGEALQAQKELLLATKEVEKEIKEVDGHEAEKSEEPKKEEEEKKIEEVKEEKNEPMMFHVAGIPKQRTSSKAPETEDRDPHDFHQLTHTLKKGLISSDVEITTAPETVETTESTTEGTIRTAIEETTTEIAEEAKKETTEETLNSTITETTEAVETEKPTPVPSPMGEMPTVGRPLSQSKMVSIVQPHDGELKTVKATDDAPTSELLEQLEAEIERKGHKEEKIEEIGEIKGEDKRAVEEIVQEEKTEKEEKDEKIEDKEGEVKKEVTEEPITTTEEPITTTEVETTTPEKLTTPLPASLNEKSKKLMKRIMRDMKKKLEKLKKKVEKLVSTEEGTTTSTAAPTTETPSTEAPTTSPEDRPSVEAEPLTESVEGSGVEVTTTEAETTTVTTTTATTEKPIIVKDQGTNFCASFANCDDLIRDYQEQCDRRFSPDIINHGIEDAEIVSVLKNATTSHNDIVLRACLRPLDKASYANLKQLLVIQRGVRRACLELGRNKNILTDEETAVCTSPLPSTEALDDFLSKTHSRSEDAHTLCLAKLAPLRETCHSIRGCCASVNACDNYIASSPVRMLREEAQDVLIKRQHACEERMLDTLKYIQKRLTTRRRRV